MSKNTAVVVTSKKAGGIRVCDMNVWMSNFCICIIDDCMDIDVPLIDVQFSRFSLSNGSKEKNENGGMSGLFDTGAQGSAEFALNIDYYNRLLSGWEPLVEPWLARLNWKLKASKNVLTVTSMDVLNVNITNPFIELIISMQKIRQFFF
jgi:vacuolar protein sorting-associated protein 13D